MDNKLLELQEKYDHVVKKLDNLAEIFGEMTWAIPDNWSNCDRCDFWFELYDEFYDEYSDIYDDEYGYKFSSYSNMCKDCLTLYENLLSKNSMDK